ncbi:C45 family autoproteolytic acyltransferase/hydolase [Roseinatronobacter bogoriensis]|uniref:6-aminopenicillanic acid acyl-transferase n=1 Tax=Roseinatronobacter bogoriensis subsp. barguzinensis TaxID=441209 RepID=A0A2K8KE14_9RHOB|nr:MULTISPECIES: C45 family peptidase [Rhodobaca]ATX67226.1 6-aminopenicillanic acid acyl-transferase [Rhodobaca barguzinensis]MBB4206773.1 putative choloylglycine hydrolase [Rhodobaca bogoriensis DSM 18756]TDW41517.1 acyl-CoA:6-aminopenicillanic acid acyl transferase [Rhodobaca barguzinensis]TDY74305.1 acyl-CoA:6-aminopenicillanic acid acyl transferase [Rhodobaca bogoriensis DSM 18756]
MSEVVVAELGWVRAAGSPYEIGFALGRAGRGAVQQRLRPLEYWRAVTDERHQPLVTRLAGRTQALFPEIYAELEGLADGLDLPFMQVMAWNCRGDLMSNVPDGCTTVQLPGPTAVLAHNEDGLPELHGSCFIAEVTGQTGAGFVACCYPGSLPGHTFAVSNAGLAQAVNNLRLRNVQPELPRMVLGRAVLECKTITEALALLARENACGGFHFTLAQAGEGALHSVEFGGGACSHKLIEGASGHANHALHHNAAPQQTITHSSRDRQIRVQSLLDAGVSDALRILRDTGGAGLPIHRTCSDDPDQENTLASAIISVNNYGVSWEFYDQSSSEPVYTGEVTAS